MDGMSQYGWWAAGAAAGVTVVASCWSYLQAFYRQVFSRVIVQVTVSGYGADSMLLYLKSRFRPSRFGPREYMGWMLFVRPRQRVQLVPMEITPKDGKLYWNGWRPLWTKRGFGRPDESESGTNCREYSDETLQLLFLRECSIRTFSSGKPPSGTTSRSSRIWKRAGGGTRFGRSPERRGSRSRA